MTEKVSKRELKMQQRAVAVAPSSFDADSRTMEVTASTGAPVLRTGWDGSYNEVLDMSGADLSRYQSGAAPLLLDHVASVANQIGSVTAARIDGGNLIATVQFSSRPDMAGYVQDIQDGILRTFSIGYVANKAVVEESEDGSPDTVTMTDFTLMELSVVSIPADAGAVSRSAETDKKTYPVQLEYVTRSATQPEVTPESPAADVGVAGEETATPTQEQEEQRNIDMTEQELAALRATAAAEAAAAERARISEIQLAVRTASLDEETATDLVTRGVSADVARQEIFTQMAARQASTRTTPRIQVITSEHDVKRDLLSASLLNRANPRAFEMPSGADEYRSMSSVDIARECLVGRGQSGRGAAADVIHRALTGTSDYPAILENVMRKSLRQGYDTGRQTFRGFTRDSETPDFKPVSRVSMGSGPNLLPVAEYEEYKSGAPTDAKEVLQVSKWGRIIPITREALINDDLSAFTRIPSEAGAAAARLESNLVYQNVLGANPNMHDGNPLFSNAHNNMMAGSAISVASVSAAEVAMSNQVDLDGNLLNITPSFLIVGTVRRTEAQQLIGHIDATQASNVNPYSGMMQLVVDARAGNAWYLAASPNDIDTIELIYLTGRKGVWSDQQVSFETDGILFKVRHEVGVGPVDWRGLVKNPGN